MSGIGQVPPPNPGWYLSSNFGVAVGSSDSQTENYFARLSRAAFAAWSARGVTSVSQTAAASNQNCASYNSDTSNPGILVLSATR